MSTPSKFTKNVMDSIHRDMQSYLLCAVNYIITLEKRVKVVQCVRTARLLQISAPPPNKFWSN
jgi:hypothetical protein